MDYDEDNCPTDGNGHQADWEIVKVDSAGEHHVAGPGDTYWDIYSPCSTDIVTDDACDDSVDVDISTGGKAGISIGDTFVYKELGYPCRVGEFDIQESGQIRLQFKRAAAKTMRVATDDPDNDPSGAVTVPRYMMTAGVIYPSPKATNITLAGHLGPRNDKSNWEIWAMVAGGPGAIEWKQVASEKPNGPHPLHQSWKVENPAEAGGDLTLDITPPLPMANGHYVLDASSANFPRMGLYRIRYHVKNTKKYFSGFFRLTNRL